MSCAMWFAWSPGRVLTERSIVLLSKIALLSKCIVLLTKIYSEQYRSSEQRISSEEHRSFEQLCSSE